MMDEATLELLSRSLDGDLDEGERQLLDQRLAEDTELGRERERLLALRAAVSGVAAREQPPTTLDDVVETLRRSRAPRPGVRPALRWLAAAAVLVVGATVSLQVARQHRFEAPKAPLTAAARTPRAHPTPYQLQPLPTRVGPEEEELLGSSDHLLASPDEEVALSPPEPLVVVGPVAAEPQRQAAAARPRSRSAGEGAPLPPASAAAEAEARRTATTRASTDATGFAPAPQESLDETEAGDPGRPQDAAVARAEPGSRSLRAGEAHKALVSTPERGILQLEGADALELPFAAAEVAPGGYLVVVEVVGERIVAARPVGEEVSASHRRVAALLVNVPAPGLADGEHRGRAVIR
jgi:hypothetical protein